MCGACENCTIECTGCLKEKCIINKRIKEKLLKRFNKLGYELDELYLLRGSFVNLEYNINGNKIKLLDDNSVYYGTQIEKEGYCLGLAANESIIVVSKYNNEGKNPELILFKNYE